MKEFHLTEEQYQQLLAACSPTPVMYGSGGVPLFRSQQENVEDAWKTLGRDLGFAWETVKPIHGKDDHYFEAEALS